MGMHLTYLAEHAVSISTFLDTRDFFQQIKRKDVGGCFLRNYRSEKPLFVFTHSLYVRQFFSAASDAPTLVQNELLAHRQCLP
jgi:hypothetical protein